jgi:hypothetical protein
LTTNNAHETVRFAAVIDTRHTDVVVLFEVFFELKLILNHLFAINTHRSSRIQIAQGRSRCGHTFLVGRKRFHMGEFVLSQGLL